MKNSRVTINGTLIVLLYVVAPTTLTLTVQETARVDRAVESARGSLAAAPFGDLLVPGTHAVAVDEGVYQLRILRDAQLHVPDPEVVTVVTTEGVKDPFPPPPPAAVGDVDRAVDVAGVFVVRGELGNGGGSPRLSVTYGDAAR